MDYQQALEYLNSFIDYEKIPSYPYKKDFSLDKVERLFEKAGSPHKQIRALHIAGTKGKGSVCAYLFSILSAAGFKTGLYTSPHLISFRERIQIAEKKRRRLIGEEEFAGLVEKVRPAIEEYTRESDDGAPSFFEVYTCLAFSFFAREKVDFAVIEVGLGGRLDATNVIIPAVTGITSVSFEHMDKLGTTLEQIAGEKADVIKSGVPVVSSRQQKKAAAVIRKVCAEKQCTLYEVGKDIVAEEISSSSSRQVFRIKSELGNYAELFTPLAGRHQIENAATALGIIGVLSSSGFDFTDEAIREGTKDVNWPGRIEVIDKHPLMVLDGAQNRASAAALAETIRRAFSYRRLILVFGCCCDKDVERMGAELCPLADEIILTRVDSPRAMDISTLKTRLSGCGKKLSPALNVREAVQLARGRAGGNDLILVTGSLYLVGEVMNIMGKRPYGEGWY